MPRRGLTAERWAYRPGQTALLVALAMLVVVSCATGPLYERAVEQATVQSTLDGGTRPGRGLAIGVDVGTPSAAVAPRGAAARLFGTPVAGTDAPIGFGRAGFTVGTTLTSRDRLCAHLRLESGRCPTVDAEVAASTTMARALHLAVGTRLSIGLDEGQQVVRPPPDVKVRVVGLYRPFSADTDYWLGNAYSSPTGITVSRDGTEGDVLFGASPFVAWAARRMTTDAGTAPNVFVDVPLRPHAVTVADLPTLRNAVAAFYAAVAAHRPGTATGVTTSLPQYLDQIDAGRRQARAIVAAIASQLALLSLIAFGVVAAAAVSQRRPEIALSRLRGASRTRAAALLVREVGGLVLLAVLPGLIFAYAVAFAACRAFLLPGSRPRWQWPVFAAAGGATAVALLMVAAVAYRAGRQPITDLLRQIPARPSRLGAGVIEIAVAVAAAAGLLVSLTGGRRTALGTLTPTFLAALVGLLASRVVVALARRFGRRALWQGSLTRAFAGLNIARRPGARFTVTVICVATAVVVFAGQQWSVAARNRTERAAAETGAAVVLDVSAPSAVPLLRAVAAADPSRRWATPVVAYLPPGVNAVPVVAVDPASFAAVATWGRRSAGPTAHTLRRLTPTGLAPSLAFRGTRLTITLVAARWRPADFYPGSAPPSVGLQIRLQRQGDDTPTAATVGALPRRSAGPLRYSVPVDCARGCRVTGLALLRAMSDSTPIRTEFTLSGLRADAPVGVGTARGWRSTTSRTTVPGTTLHTGITVRQVRAGLAFSAVDDSSGSTMQYVDRPFAAPALVAGAVPDDRDELGYLTVDGIGGLTGRVVVRGHVPFVPQVGGSAVLLDLNLQSRLNPQVASAATSQVWLRSADRPRERALRRALGAAGIKVLDRRTAAGLRATYIRSAPAWSAQLTVLAALVAELLAATLLVLLVITSRRARQQDFAAMRLDGVPRRSLSASLLLELCTLVLAGVLAGTLAGLIGVRLALPAIPVFTTPAIVPLPVSYSLAWWWLAGAVALSVVLLVAAAAVVTARLAGRPPIEQASAGLR